MRKRKTPASTGAGGDHDPVPFQVLAERRLAQRYGLPPSTAAVVAQLAGLGPDAVRAPR